MQILEKDNDVKFYMEFSPVNFDHDVKRVIDRATWVSENAYQKSIDPFSIQMGQLPDKAGTYFLRADFLK